MWGKAPVLGSDFSEDFQRDKDTTSSGTSWVKKKKPWECEEFLPGEAGL